ncbi:MAG: DUF4365 domain-containing protein [Nitrososphaerales archaeon]
MSVNRLIRGVRGQTEVQQMLEKALDGATVNSRDVPDDMGIDLQVEMRSTTTHRYPLNFGVQVKTGGSFVEEHKKFYKLSKQGIRALSARWDQYQNSDQPVLLVWLKHSEPIEGYWQFINRDSSIDHFLISKSRTISPLTKYDLTLRLCGLPPQTRKLVTVLPYTGNIGVSFRAQAKQLYRGLLGMKETNPILGQTTISLHGWRNITSQRRPSSWVARSLQLIPAIRVCISDPGEIEGFRTIKDMQRGKRRNCVRLVTFRKKIKLKYGPQTEVICKIREIINYPVNWRDKLEPGKDTVRTCIFEDIFEKT